MEGWTVEAAKKSVVPDAANKGRGTSRKGTAVYLGREFPAAGGD